MSQPSRTEQVSESANGNDDEPVGQTEEGVRRRPGLHRSNEAGAPGRREFTMKSKTQAEEDAYDWASHRDTKRLTSSVGSVAHLVKGALGGGIMSVHVGFKMAGLGPAIVITLLSALYVGYCLYTLIRSAQILYKRTQIATMSYPDVGEAAVACFPNPKVARWSKCYRYAIDFIVCLDLFGACACYHLMISKTIKQLVENTKGDHLEGLNGMPHLRVYLAAMIIPIILISLITELKWLAPFSLVANFFIFLCILVTIYYFAQYNPGFKNVKWTKDITGAIEFLGISFFSISCVGIIVPVSNNMKKPEQFTPVLLCGMSIITLFVFSMAFFGYCAFLEKSQSPITLNFPLTTIPPKILKGLIAFMIYVTHALNFFTPFHLCWYYIQRKHKSHLLLWQLFYRTIFVIIIGLIAIVFPNIVSLLGFLGGFCLSIMALIWPNFIEILVLYERPGYGPYKWRLYKCIILMIIGTILMFLGSVANLRKLMLAL